MVETQSAEAVFFFNDEHEIIKEMTYAEFQAILDNYVPLHDIATREMRAVYLRINSKLHATAAVFFQISFDKEGFIEKSWNIPLQQLADSASKGPNMGSGPINLVCFSQCSQDWHRKQLWDPAMETTLNDFVSIKKALKNNNLGLVFKKAVEDDAGTDKYNEERTRAALMIKEQRLRNKLLTTKSEQDKRQLALDHQERVLAYQQQINDYQQQLNEQRALNLELKENLATQSNNIAGMRDYFESKIESLQSHENGHIESIREHYQAELNVHIETAVSEYKEAIKSRDVELLYRSEQYNKLKEEILHLQNENKKLLESSSNSVLDKLSNAGVSFVIYHPGAGHLSIQATEINDYLKNPTAFVARHCGVNEHLYRTWLDHFYSPTCQFTLDSGELCENPLTQTDDPSQFIIGESDLCPIHRAQKQTPSVISISKNGRPGAYSAKN
jgi:predicted transposase YbfD/YdcC